MLLFLYHRLDVKDRKMPKISLIAQIQGEIYSSSSMPPTYVLARDNLSLEYV